MPRKPVIYALLPRLFNNPNEARVPNGCFAVNGSGKLSAFTTDLLHELAAFGCTHIWPIGLIRHASRTDYPCCGITNAGKAAVKGHAGSPYAVNDYYDIDPDLADVPARRMEEFDDFVLRVHTAGLKLIIDFVPNHTARVYSSIMRPPYIQDFGTNDDRTAAFSPQNNYYYIPGTVLTIPGNSADKGCSYTEYPAKVTGNDCCTPTPSALDWYDTAKLNYGINLHDKTCTGFDPIPDTWQKMLDILAYWTAKGVDGFRCDMAEMIPVEFWRWIIPKIRNGKKTPLFIAEIYVPDLYTAFSDAGFDFLYDKVGMYDVLRRVGAGLASTSEILAARENLSPMSRKMLYFLENHDEQRIASDFFDSSPHMGLLLSAIALFMGQGAFLFYFGQSLGERGMDAEGYSGVDGRTSIFDYWSIASMQRFHRKELRTEEADLHENYRRLLQQSTSDSLASDGEFYALNVACPEPDLVSAFARHNKAGEILLVLVNLAKRRQDISLNTNEHFLETTGIGLCKGLARYRLSDGSRGFANLTPYAPFITRLAPESYELIRFSKL